MAGSVAFTGVASPFERPIFARARTLCLKWPEVTEKTAWGHPTFRAGKKMFVAFEMIKGRPTIAFKISTRRATRFLGRSEYFASPYGRNEWVSIHVDGKVDWDAIEALIEESYRSVATKGMLRLIALAACLLVIGASWMRVGAQHAGAFRGSLDDPAIAYATRPLDNVVADVNRKLQDGTLRFSFDSRNGYLNSAIAALGLPVDSQLLVYSRGSLQGKLIDEHNPRALFFSDRVALGWVRDGDVLEVAAHDATAGVVFYTLSNVRPPDPPQFKRVFHCLGCHVTGDTLGVPGLLMFSTSRRTGTQFDGVPRHIDQSDPLSQRFGGWFITGSTGGARHMGNEVGALDDSPSRELASVDRLFDTDGYRAATSDVVAQMVLTHQAGMTNLLTRAAFEARLATGDPALVEPIMNGIASEVVDHLLFQDETKLSDRVRGSSGFAERFSKSGPRDRKGRSLYELDLNTRLFKYPCSYLIYSPAFDALPPVIKAPIYRRMWEVLQKQENGQAVIDILRDTRNDLPAYWRVP